VERKHRLRIVAGAGAGLALAAGGAAIGATQLGSPAEESEAIVNDAARQLGITPSALSDALKQALANRVDEAVEEGRLSREQADAIKARIESGNLPLFGIGRGRPGHPGLGHRAGLDAAASYLGLTESELRSQLAAGRTLAQVARDRGKSVDGLVQAIATATRERLDEAVESGRLTRARADEILEGLEERITDLVNGRAGPRLRFRGGVGAERPLPPLTA
jgi:hypothetical protein